MSRKILISIVAVSLLCAGCATVPRTADDASRWIDDAGRWIDDASRRGIDDASRWRVTERFLEEKISRSIGDYKEGGCMVIKVAAGSGGIPPADETIREWVAQNVPPYNSGSLTPYQRQVEQDVLTTANIVENASEQGTMDAQDYADMAKNLCNVPF